MKTLLHLSLLLLPLLAAPVACRAQVYSVRVIGSIWELPPEERTLFIADHSGSVWGIRYMHTPAFGWTIIAGGRSFTLAHSSTGPEGALTLGVTIFAGATLILLCSVLRRRA